MSIQQPSLSRYPDVDFFRAYRRKPLSVLYVCSMIVAVNAAIIVNLLMTSGVPVTGQYPAPLAYALIGLVEAIVLARAVYRHRQHTRLL